MHADAIVKTALELAEAGLSQAAIARQLDLPRSTVRDWLRSDTPTLAVREQRRSASRCDGTCVDADSLDSAAHAYLLGQYLGDGCISAVKLSFRLRISCCDDYPGIKDECAQAISAVQTAGHVRRCQRVGCTELSDSWHHWPCLLPHGEGGVKHRRVVTLAGWQRDLALGQSPASFVRGLIHSDGWRGTNRWPDETASPHSTASSVPSTDGMVPRVGLEPTLRGT